MTPSTLRTRSAAGALAWPLLVALAALAALLLARVTGLPGVLSRPSSPMHLAASSGRSAVAPPTSASSGSSSQTASTSSKTIKVSITGYAFKPSSLTIHVGDTVTWTNEDSAPHTVTSSSGPEKLDSPQLKKGQSWSFTFDKAGSYAYYCAVHPDMKGSLTVQGSSTSGGGMSGGSSGSTCEPSLTSAVVDPFWMHFKHGHLDESPGQQVNDILNPDQYVKTHTVLVQDMTNTAEQEATAHAADGPEAFWMHFKHGHLDESPGQQVNDILNPDQYVKTHTVLVQDMTDPYVGVVTGTC